MKQWYEIDTELLEVEKIAMSNTFPHFKLETLEDGRLYWIGDLIPGIYETKFNECFIYTVMAIYMADKIVRIYPILPDSEDMAFKIGERCFYKDEEGNLYLKLDRFIKRKNYATDSIYAANEWLKKYEMIICGYASNTGCTGCLSQI